MGLYSRDVCVECNTFMKRIKNGVAVLLGVHTNHVHADLEECPKCKKKVIKNWSNNYCDCDQEIDYRVD